MRLTEKFKLVSLPNFPEYDDLNRDLKSKIKRKRRCTTPAYLVTVFRESFSWASLNENCTLGPCGQDGSG